MTKSAQEDGRARTPRPDVSAIIGLHQRNMAAMMSSWLHIAEGFGVVAARQQELAAATLSNLTEMTTGFGALGQP